MEETNERQHVDSDISDSSTDVHVQSDKGVNVVDSADLGASKPIPEKKPTSKEIGEYRNRHFTVRHSTVVACGHKIDLRQYPSNANCWDCWEAFFSVSPEGVAQVHQMLMEGGTQEVTRRFGSKFVKKFGKFLQKQLLQAAQQRHEQAVERATSIEGGIMDVKAESEAPLGLR